MSPDDANLSLTHDSLSPTDDPTSRTNIVGIYDQGTTPTIEPSLIVVVF